MGISYSLSIIVAYLVLIFAYWYGRKTKEWKWSEYFLMALGPFVGLVILALLEGSKVIIFFVLSAAVGFLAEFTFGLLFDKTLGRKLWLYKKCAVKGYTSPLSLPFWGAAGIIFLALAKLLNL